MYRMYRTGWKTTKQCDKNEEYYDELGDTLSEFGKIWVRGFVRTNAAKRIIGFLFTNFQYFYAAS